MVEGRDGFVRSGFVRSSVIVAALGGTLLLACRRLGLAPHDVAIACAVGGYAMLQRRWERQRTVLLGEPENRVPVRWLDFMREHRLRSRHHANDSAQQFPSERLQLDCVSHAVRTSSSS